MNGNTADPPSLSPTCAGRFCTAYGTLSFLMGFALIIGGPRRVTAPAYSVMVNEGGPKVWGTVFLVIGVALLMSADYAVLTRWLLLVGGLAYWILAGAFLVAAFIDPTANLTAVVAYGWIAASHLYVFSKLRLASRGRRSS